jgi:hypothetical protein
LPKKQKKITKKKPQCGGFGAPRARESCARVVNAESRARFQEFGPAPDFECGHSNRLADVDADRGGNLAFRRHQRRGSIL